MPFYSFSSYNCRQNTADKNYKSNKLDVCQTPINNELNAGLLINILAKVCRVKKNISLMVYIFKTYGYISVYKAELYSLKYIFNVRN